MNAPQHLRILLVEDSPTDALLIREALAEVDDFGHDLVQAERLADAISRCAAARFDIVLLDLGLPDAHGISTFRIFRDRVPELPVLVFTGLDDKSVGLQAIQDGAQDYLVKRSLDPSELSRAIRYAIERHRIARALEESEERFELAVRGASAGLWDWNPQSGAIWLSPYFKKILGYEPDEFPDDTAAVREATHPADIERVDACLAAHLEQMRPYDIEYRMRTKSGAYCWVHARAQALWNQFGQPNRMLGWIIDVTERRLAEEALRASREELQRLSAGIEQAREEEKTRIARELHDDFGQQLVALKIACARLDTLVSSSDSPEGKADLENVYRLIDQLVVSVRRIATDLRPAMLDDLGLIPALEWLVNRFSERHGVRVTRRIAEDIDFNDDSATAVFRIVQEALTNVARHAQATEVLLEIVRKEPYCVVRISDNGRGSAPDQRPAADSFGLLGIRERAWALRGDLQIQTAPGRGFAITVSLPLDTIEARIDSADHDRSDPAR
ncbi:PAS domain-containing protein [Paraburkholderia sp. MMS20-SJTN17]|uniref:PAS domain-containing protein n=1 Tax=Paraburkholderia translucens TaxID=2886945 RepID=A0ABS8K700_9BURK|nr:PAS domain-containing protein [Paraburkholderia sp. MMS20-SJTN17]MCC8400526.1 PAS domain-containing protein [Paraburkholderia sp. MMS20-SJTN17]